MRSSTKKLLDEIEQSIRNIITNPSTTKEQLDGLKMLLETKKKALENPRKIEMTDIELHKDIVNTEYPNIDVFKQYLAEGILAILAGYSIKLDIIAGLKKYKLISESTCKVTRAGGKYVFNFYTDYE